VHEIVDPTKKLKISDQSREIELVVLDDPSLDFVVREIFEQHCYRPVLDQGTVQLVVDIGANQGLAAARFRMDYPDARIVCFEPYPPVLAVLRINAKQLGNCDVQPVGLMDRDGQLRFYAGATGNAAGSFVRHALSKPGPDTLPVKAAGPALQELNLTEIDVLKIDTEGSEIGIMTSIGRQLERTRVLYVEFHSENDRRTIDDMMQPSHFLWRGEIVSAHRGTLCYVRRDVAPNDPVRQPIGSRRSRA